MATLNLVKGQKLNLKKDNGQALTIVKMGLGWEPARGLSSIDLDASCLFFDDNNNLTDQVWFRQLKSKDGSVKHSGDRKIVSFA